MLVLPYYFLIRCDAPESLIAFTFKTGDRLLLLIKGVRKHLTTHHHSHGVTVPPEAAVEDHNITNEKTWWSVTACNFIVFCLPYCHRHHVEADNWPLIRFKHQMMLLCVYFASSNYMCIFIHHASFNAASCPLSLSVVYSGWGDVFPSNGTPHCSLFTTVSGYSSAAHRLFNVTKVWCCQNRKSLICF